MAHLGGDGKGNAATQACPNRRNPMKIDPNEPVRPVLADHYNKGMTIRAEIASRCMVGLIVAGGISDHFWGVHATAAVRAADALIAELNKEPVE